MNDDSRLAQKEREVSFLSQEKNKNSHLFVTETFIDDAEFLNKLGIYIPGKENLPSGFLKYRPEDFIVEEIDLGGKIHDVSLEQDNVLDEEGQSLYATLVKCGLSTIEAQEEVGRVLNIPPNQIQYSGIKDKDALTSQKISIRGLRKEYSEKFNSPYIFLKNIYTGKGVTEKGALKGNKFTILIRVGKDLGDKIKMDAFLKALEKVKRDGFYNFYYIQRFGNPRLNNFLWGILLLRGDYENAVKEYLCDIGLRETLYFKEKREKIREAIPNWNNVLEIIKDLPIMMGSENKMVKYLINHPTDYLGAMRTISDQVNFWAYGLSAYLYNRQISSYLRAGMEPPKEITLFLSKDKNDWLPYADDLEAFGIFPPSFEPLRPFPQIRTEGVKVKTKDHVEIHSTEVIDQGIIVEFSLGKGEYATTFLSHIANLISGEVPEDIHDEKIDTKVILGKGNLEKTFEYFEPVSKSKRDNSAVE